MRLRHIALGCATIGAIGFLALPPATALAAGDGAAGHAAAAKATLKLHAPAMVAFGTNVVITGHLSFGAKAPSAGTEISVTRKGPGAAAETFYEYTTAGGSFTITDPAPADGSYTYTAAFAGSAGEAPASASATVLVEVPRTALSISSAASWYRYKSQVALTVTLGKTYASRRVSIYVTPAGESRRLWTTGEVDAAGKLFKSFVLTRTTTFTVVFAGDAQDNPATASRTLYSVATVTDAITGYDRTTKIGGVAYDVFHSKDTLVLHSTVVPDKHGECLQPETEQWDAGVGWDADTKYGCDTLDVSSHDRAPFNLAQAINDRYRIRADYVHGKDPSNSSADSGWIYFEVVS
jgi:hypothetical protein